MEKQHHNHWQPLKKIEPQVIDEVWPRFTFTDEENRILQSTGEDINKYVEEMRDKFITGDEDLDGWDNYVQTIEQMGMEELLEVYQAAYDRYQSN